MKAIIPIGAGIIVSVAGYIYAQRSRDVGSWMRQRRIPSWDEEDKKCPECGARMVPAKTKADGQKVWYCKSWRTCKTYIDHATGKRLPVEMIESGRE